MISPPPPEGADLIDAVRANGLLAHRRPVMVMYSGGRDSTCLLDLAVRICTPEKVKALHLNYGLRQSADQDERHCAELCAALGVELSVRKPRLPASGNLQAWAREERYAAARELAGGADVATGHTATDQVETILYRLASSPSRRALLGMRPRDGDLIRPLLDYTREETAAYCVERGLGWREDETNESDSFARGRIRHDVVPALRTVHPNAEGNVIALSEILRGEAEVLDAMVDEILAGGSTIELARLRSMDAPLRRLVVQRLADQAAGRPAAGVARRADEVAALSGDRSAALDVGGGVRALVERGVVRFVPWPASDGGTG